jgi:hypothetical protein
MPSRLIGRGSNLGGPGISSRSGRLTAGEAMRRPPRWVLGNESESAVSALGAPRQSTALRKRRAERVWRRSRNGDLADVAESREY